MTALYAVAAALGLLLLLLAVPLEAQFRFERNGSARGYALTRWLFGLVRFRIDLPASGSASPAGKLRAAGDARHKRKPPKRKRRRRGGGGRHLLAVLRQAPFRRRCFRFTRQIIEAAHLQDLRVAMRLGLDDPADTGRLWALLGPVSAAARNIRGAEITIAPEFNDAVLEIRAHGQLRVIPLQLIAVTIAFALAPASLRAWYTLAMSHG